MRKCGTVLWIPESGTVTTMPILIGRAHAVGPSQRTLPTKFVWRRISVAECGYNVQWAAVEFSSAQFWRLVGVAWLVQRRCQVIAFSYYGNAVATQSNQTSLLAAASIGRYPRMGSAIQRFKQHATTAASRQHTGRMIRQGNVCARRKWSPNELSRGFAAARHTHFIVPINPNTPNTLVFKQSTNNT